MRFLIDVCVGGRLSVWLSEIGHDVKEVRSINPSMSDEEIMELALIEKRIIITADKDFGELYIRKGKMHCGIIRVADVPFYKRKSLIKRVLQEHADDLSNIIIVFTNHIRIRRIYIKRYGIKNGNPGKAMNMTLETIFEAAHRESAVLFALDEVERRLHRLTAAREGLCARLAAHVIQAGGKRLRPLLVILCGGPGPDREPVLDVAVAAELIHTASLIHDDILDGADTRRGVPTINALWGNHAAVLTGDFLFAAAFGLLAGEQTRGAMALMTEAVQAMCQGEMEEGESLFQTSLTEDAYIAHIEKKTASLLAACCGAGALAGGASPETAAALAAFGRNLGLAYQIVDDLLDFSSDDCTLGKPANSDLARGVLTLPVIYLLQEGSHRAAVEEIIAGRACGPEGFARIKKAAEETAALAYAYQKALHFAGQSRDCLASIPYLPSREMLLALADRVVSRKS